MKGGLLALPKKCWCEVGPPISQTGGRWEVETLATHPQYSGIV